MENSKEMIIAEQTKYIIEACDFVEAPTEGLKVDLTMQGERTVVIWELPSYDPPVAGSYELSTSGLARLSVVMTLGLMRHRYHTLIYDTIILADGFMHPGGEARNNLLEIAIRAAIAAYMEKGVPDGKIMGLLEKEYHFKQNFVDMQTVYIYRKASRQLGDKLLQGKRRIQ